MAKYFRDDEFRCRCARPECDAPTFPGALLLERMDAWRERYGHPIVVTSGARCAFWNVHEGGKKDSGHLTADEVDVRCLNSRERYELLEAAFSPTRLFLRLGLGRTFLHVGVSARPEHAQRVAWTYYTKPKGPTGG